MPNPTRVRFVTKIDCGGDLRACPQVSSARSLPIELCQIKDLSGSRVQGMYGGFPRPLAAAVANKTPKILIMPVSFTDLKFVDPVKELAGEIRATQQFYENSSLGRLQLSFVVPSATSIIHIGEAFLPFKDRFNGDLQEVTDALLSEIPVALTADVDGVVLTTPRSKTVTWGGGGGPLWRGLPTYLYVGGDRASDLPHLLGHVLYALPDLYISGPAISDGFKVPSNHMFYDIMANGLSNDFVGWNRWLNGWLSDDEIHCVDPKGPSEVRYLRFLDDRSAGARLIAVPLSEHKVILAEFRSASKEGYCCGNFDENGRGLLVYSYDTSIRAGFSQMRMYKVELQTNGQTAELDGIKFTVVAVDQHGMYVEIRSD